MTELIKVTTDGLIERVAHEGPVKDIRVFSDLIGCQWVERIQLQTSPVWVDIWLDDNRHDQPHNTLISRVTGVPILGNVVFASMNKSQTESVGLSTPAADGLVELLVQAGGEEE